MTYFYFFFNDTATTEIYTLSLHDALPIWFIAGGVRVFASPRAMASSPPPGQPTSPALQPLVAQHRGDTAFVRFRMPGARKLEIAGNWNAWTPAPLRAMGEEVWEAGLLLAPGTYYFNLVVDG